MLVIYSVISILTTILLYLSRSFKNTFSYPEYIRYAYLLPNHKNQFAFCCSIILGCLKWWVLKHKFMSKKIKFISIKSGCPWVHLSFFPFAAGICHILNYIYIIIIIHLTQHHQNVLTLQGTLLCLHNSFLEIISNV